jgi:DNA-binding transcriptional LysR family regulator
MRTDSDRLPPLDLLAAFDAVARLGSITLAAHERFLTQSAVSRQIKALEEHLGVDLFRRRHRAIELTDAGQRLAAAVSSALGVVRGAVTEIRAPLRREVISLTTTPGLASLWLIPRLNDFTAMHPGVDVRIDATLDMRDLARDGFDLAIRYAPVGSVPGAPLFEEVLQPACTPALARSRRLPLRTPADLARHTLLQVAGPLGSGMPMEWQSWLKAVGVPDLEPSAMLTFNNYDAAVAAALAGQGVVLGRRPLIDALLARRELVTPFSGSLAKGRGYTLFAEPVAGRRPAVKALHDWLLAQARR